MRLRDLRNSVTGRLIASATGTLVFVITGAVSAELLNSRKRIDAEIHSSTSLAETVIGYALRGLSADPSPDDTIWRLAQHLSGTRHIEVQYLPQDGASPKWQPDHRPRGKHAPSWFVRLFDTTPTRTLYPVTVNGAAHGTLVVTGYGDNELDEIWDDLCREVLWLTVVTLLVTLAMVWVAHHALRPVEAVADGLDRMSQGHFTVLDDADVYELRRLSERFNTLAASLQRAGADNRLLIDRIMTIQESEREDVARELHDEMGALLFSIRAELVALRRSELRTEIAADNIADLEGMIEEMQWRNGRLLERLRPMALDHLSFADALRDLVGAREGRAGGICWQCDIEGDIGNVNKDTGLAIYRIVQECLTNVSRHAQASHASVRVWCNAETQKLHVEVVDDGVGPPLDMRVGYGLLGAIERVRKLGGVFRIDRHEQGGMIVGFHLPAATTPAE